MNWLLILFIAISFVSVYLGLRAYLTEEKILPLFLYPLIGYACALVVWFIIVLKLHDETAGLAFFYILYYGCIAFVITETVLLIYHRTKKTPFQKYFFFSLIAVFVLIIIVTTVLVLTLEKNIKVTDAKRANLTESDDIELQIHTCYEYGYNQKHDLCLLDVQESFNEKGFCNRVTFLSEENKAKCLMSQSATQSDEESCLLMKSGPQKDLCLRRLALALDSLEPCTKADHFFTCVITLDNFKGRLYCENYSDYWNSSSGYESCLAHDASITGNVSICEGMKNLRPKIDCFTGIAKKFHNVSFCDELLTEIPDQIQHLNQGIYDSKDSFYYACLQEAGEKIPVFSLTECIELNSSCKDICKARNLTCKEMCHNGGKSIGTDVLCKMTKRWTSCLDQSPGFGKCCCG
jgi:hypothetical protein